MNPEQDDLPPLQSADGAHGGDHPVVLRQGRRHPLARDIIGFVEAVGEAGEDDEQSDGCSIDRDE
jgi:hypothetical protein